MEEIKTQALKDAEIVGGTSMQDIDFAWYVENISRLYDRYGSCYIVIKNKTVIGRYETYEDGVISTMKQETIGTFIVQRCAKSIEECIEYI